MSSFDVTADAYDRFMGRFSEPLAPVFLAFTGVKDGRVLDVGSGPGALTALLQDRLGAGSVAAVDPSPRFVDALRRRCPAVDVREASAERLPFADGTFDVALAQLVVHFMADPVAGLREMRRVTRPGGVLAACVWDHSGDEGPLSAFWRAARDLDPRARGEADLPGARPGHLEALLESAGLGAVRSDVLRVTVRFTTFDEWWEPFLLGVGPAGTYVAGLDADRRAALRDRCAETLPERPFAVSAAAWAAMGTA